MSNLSTLGKIHDVYYVWDIENDVPVIGTETVFPSVAERKAITLNLLAGTTEQYEVRVWAKTLAVPVYGQQDPRWKDEKLGFGVSTIGAYGCVITSLAMMLTAIEAREITPLDVNEALKAANGFTGSTKNLVVWEAVQRAYPSVLFQGLYVCEKVPAPVAKIDRHISTAGNYCVVQVDFNPSADVPGVQSHYMLIVAGNSADGYTVHDPWHANPLAVPPAYCLEEWNAARAIFRVTYWSKAA